MMNEYKICPMKFGSGEPTSRCEGEQCAWWIPYDDDTAGRIGESGRCVACGIHNNLWLISAHIENL